MNRTPRVFVFLTSALLLVAIMTSLWARLGPMGSSVSQALASNGNYVAGAENEKEADHPYEAAAFRALSLMDENGNIPADGLMKGKAQLDAMLRAQRNEALNPNGWTWLGPGNVGGRIRSIVIHPSSPNTMWVGSVSGGIWKTTDGGASWAIQTDFLTNMAVVSMVMDPTNPNVLYAGTGESFGSYGVTNKGNGVFKTTNGGTTWTQLASTNNSDWYYTSRLSISPANSNYILAVNWSGIWRSLDGGASWTQEYVSGSYGLSDVDFNPSDGNKAIASSFGGGEAYYSVDGGDTWFPATGLPANGRVELAYYRNNPNNVYALVNDNNGEVYKSTDGGQSYTLVNTGSNLLANGQGDYDNIIWVNPIDENQIITGGIDLFRSTNGGGTFTKISDWQHQPFYGAGDSVHADQHMIVEHPQFNNTSNKIVFFGNDGGIYKNNDVSTADIHTGWTELNNNLGITQFYGAAGNPTTGTIIGGTQDNGSLLYTLPPAPKAGRSPTAAMAAGLLQTPAIPITCTENT